MTPFTLNEAEQALVPLYKTEMVTLVVVTLDTETVTVLAAKPMGMREKICNNMQIVRVNKVMFRMEMRLACLFYSCCKRKTVKRVVFIYTKNTWLADNPIVFSGI